MFGLFNKKENMKEEKNNPEYLVLVDKWDAFLKKIDSRFNESLVHAEEAIMDNLVESDYDMLPTERAWGGIKSQLQDLSKKIEKTFKKNVKPQMLAYVERGDIIDQDQKGTLLGDSFYTRIERFEIILEGKIAQKFYNHAIQFLNEDFQCSQCSAKLEVKKDIFRSHYVSCDYCNTVNTFTPNDKIAEIRWVIENIAKYKALGEWDQKIKAHKACKNIPSLSEKEDKTDLKIAYDYWEVKEKDFWTKYFTERAAFLPEYEESIEHDVDVKMKLFFYDDRERSDLNY